MFEIVYIINIFSDFIIQLFFHKKMHKKIYMFFSYIVIVLVASIRNVSVGADTENYRNMFELVKMEADRKSIHGEAVFYLYLKCISQITSDFRVYLLLTAVITYALFYIYIYYNSEDYVIGILLFIALFYPDSMNIARQYMAIGIAINFQTALNKNRKKTALALCVLAYFVHKSVIIYLFLALLYQYRQVRIIKMIYFFVLVILWSFIYLSDFLILLIGKSNYSYYLSTKYMGPSITNGGMSRAYLIVMIFGWTMLILSYCFIKKNKVDYDYYYYLFISSVGTILVIASNKFVILTRAAVMFDIFIIVFLPFFISKSFSKRTCIIIRACMYLFLFVAVHVMGRNMEYATWL